MSPVRDTPYGAFNFIVDLGDGDRAGFAEVTGLSSTLSTMEYRTGSDATSFTRKIPGLRRTPEEAELGAQPKSLVTA